MRQFGFCATSRTLYVFIYIYVWKAVFVVYLLCELDTESVFADSGAPRAQLLSDMCIFDSRARLHYIILFASRGFIFNGIFKIIALLGGPAVNNSATQYLHAIKCNLAGENWR